MYPASEQFHAAVRAANPITRVLLRFGDTFLDNEDIQAGGGLRVVEGFNLETDLTIGTCPAAQLTATVVNYHGLLSGFPFGSCRAYLGVRTGVDRIPASTATAVAVLRYDDDQPILVEGRSTEPYLTIDGQPPTAQPPFPVYSLLVVDDVVNCISEDGDVWAAQWIDGDVWSHLESELWSEMESRQWDTVQGVLVPLTEVESWGSLEGFRWEDLESRTWASFAHAYEYSDFMVHKFIGWARDRRGFSFTGDSLLHEFSTDGLVQRFEYVPLGVFDVTTPERRKVDLIAISALDHMARFDVPADTFWYSLTYPISLGQIYAGLCDFVGVSSATTTFINSSRVFEEAPIQVQNVTAREILGWVAEAACATARMTRDGEVELAWLGERAIDLPADQLFAISPAEYEVPVIEKLLVANSNIDVGVTIGEGENGYQILDNPFLYGGGDTEIRTYAAPIFSRLSAVPSFAPALVNAVGDWAIQAGDVISFTYKDATHRLPIYCQTLTWLGRYVRADYESTGSDHRPVRDASTRRLFEQRRSIHDLKVDVEGVYSRIESTEGEITELRLTADGLSLEVFNEDGSSRIEQLAGRISLVVTSADQIDAASIVASINSAGSSVRVRAGHISLEGHVTANGNFSIDAQGNMSANNGSFRGSVTATGGQIGGFTVNASTLSSSGLTINPSGRLDFASYASLYSTGSSTHLQSYSTLWLDAPTVRIGLDYDSLSIAHSGVRVNDPLYLNNVPQSSGGNMYLALNLSTGQVLWSNPSSIRYKDDIEFLPDDALDIMALEPIRFTYKGDVTKRENVGLIAEDVAELLPGLAVTRHGIIESIDYMQIIPYLIKEVQKIWKHLG